jgi:hypothetical protein
LKGRNETTAVGTRDSNAAVECWFGSVKRTILDSNLLLRPGRFIRRIKQEVLSRAKEIILDIPKTQGKRKRRHEETDAQALIEEEKWGKRTKKIGKNKGTSFSAEGILNLEVEAEEKRTSVTKIGDTSEPLFVVSFD